MTVVDIDSLSRLLRLQEEERRRVAIELHDELGQMYAAVQFKLAFVRDRVRDEALAAQIAEAIELVRDAADSVRDVALDLRPSMLDDLGLEAALRWYAERFARQSGIAVHLAADFLPPIDAGHATVCFRVVQEALTNIARHANARNVWLDAHASSDTLQLTVRDDGVGFDVAAARRRALLGESLGILGMEERVAHVGGTLRWTSARGSGTTVLVRIPLPRSDAA